MIKKSKSTSSKKTAVPTRAVADDLPMFIINKSQSGLTRVRVNDFKGKLTVDVRFNYRDKADGKYKPGPKGTSIPLHLAKKFHIRLGKLIAEAEALDLEGANGIGPNETAE